MTNEMKERAYEAVKKMFARYIDSANNGYCWAEEERMAYAGACEVFESVFGEEFMLTDEDRAQLIG